MTISATLLQPEQLRARHLNQTGKRKARILVVDDDPGLLRLLTIRLRAESYDVEAVESASQALAAASRFRHAPARRCCGGSRNTSRPAGDRRGRRCP